MNCDVPSDIAGKTPDISMKCFYAHGRGKERAAKAARVYEKIMRLNTNAHGRGKEKSSCPDETLRKKESGICQQYRYPFA